jgi:predicted DNA-binding transcriptional regulator AlpA
MVGGVVRRVDPAELIDTETVASLMGLSRGTAVGVYRARYPDFPVPVVDMGRGRCRLWLRSDVERWVRARRLQPRPRRARR